ncbi:MAG: RAMP superfamily CRISPR-associated protein [Candidatus Syntrophoarchaeum sp.]|nr:RAMP superfamily CRISPR-associated protein [Candidatus Syntrophoarchaeum sp.]
MKVWEVDIELLSDLHTAGERRGSLINVLRRDGKVYLPGSHIKGVVRTEAERIWFGKNGKRICWVTGDPYGTEKEPAGIKPCGDRSGCPVCELFGVPEQERWDERYLDPALRFTDFVLLRDKGVSERTHVMILRDKGSKREGALFSERTIPRGSIFRGFILMIRDLGGGGERLLEGALHSAADYGFGGGRSRGLGWVRVRIDKDSSIGRMKEGLS